MKGIMALIYQVFDKKYYTTNTTYDLHVDYDNDFYGVDLTVKILPLQTFTTLKMNNSHVSRFHYALRESNPVMFAVKLKTIEKNELIQTSQTPQEVLGIAEEIITIINQKIHEFSQKRKAILTIHPLTVYL